jgi:hypothetical protein
LNTAEGEFSVLPNQCLDRRIGASEILQPENYRLASPAQSGGHRRQLENHHRRCSGEAAQTLPVIPIVIEYRRPAPVRLDPLGGAGVAVLMDCTNEFASPYKDKAEEFSKVP